MHILLLSENLRQAQFVQKGLHYENLSTDVLLLSASESEISHSIMNNDGVFLLITDAFSLEKYVDLCLCSKNIPLIVLAQQYHVFFNELLDHKKKIRNFFVRPFPFRLLASEMRALIFQNREDFLHKTLKIRDLELNRETREICFQGRCIYLSNKEFGLLEFFMLNAGRILSRATILENVWDRNANILTNTVDVHINKLRRKIDDQSLEKFIRTVPCSGYIFG